MMIFDRCRDGVEALLTTPGKELGRWARFARFQIQLWQFCAKRLQKNNAMAMSAALSFRTIFALVPALVLAILVAKSVNALDDSKDTLQQLLKASGITEITLVQERDETGAADATEQGPPQEKISAADYIQGLVERVEGKLTIGRIGPVGGALLIWTALTLLTTIERSLNRIYGARHSRGLIQRTMLYWSVLTLGPVILILARSAGQAAVEASQDISALSWLVSGFGQVGPVLVGIMLLAALYKLMPNTKVGFRAAAGGALVAVPLWLLAKWGFGKYVQLVVGGGSIYGALGLLPIFLMWLNLSWWIFLFGAELSNAAANLGRMQLAELAARINLGPFDMLAGALAVARPYHTGMGAVEFGQIAATLNLPDETVERILDRLVEIEVVSQVGGDGSSGYLLTRPAERIPVLEVFEIERNAPKQAVGSYGAQIDGMLAKVKAQTHAALGSLSLADTINNE